MDTFFVLLALCAGNSPVIGEFPSHVSERSSSNNAHQRIYDITEPNQTKTQQAGWFRAWAQPKRADVLLYRRLSLAEPIPRITPEQNRVHILWDVLYWFISLQWRHNERDGVSNHRRLHCLLNCWFRRRSKKTSMLRVTGLCAGNSPVTGDSHTKG